MSHVTVTMIGTHEDLDWIYENCTTDSSSETTAEQAFGYDWLSENEYPYEPTEEEVEEVIRRYPGLDTEEYRSRKHIWWRETKYGEEYPLFTKKDKAFQYLLEGHFDANEVLDLRPREDWRNFAWNDEEKRHKTKEEIIEDFKKLPDDVTFFFGEAHL